MDINIIGAKDMLAHPYSHFLSKFIILCTSASEDDISINLTHFLRGEISSKAMLKELRINISTNDLGIKLKKGESATDALDRARDNTLARWDMLNVLLFAEGVYQSPPQVGDFSTIILQFAKNMVSEKEDDDPANQEHEKEGTLSD